MLTATRIWFYFICMIYRFQPLLNGGRAINWEDGEVGSGMGRAVRHLSRGRAESFDGAQDKLSDSRVTRDGPVACASYQNVFGQLRLTGVLQTDRLGGQKKHGIIRMKNRCNLNVPWYRVIGDAHAVDLNAQFNGDPLAV